MPLISSVPTLRSPTVGRSRSNTMRAMAEPMIAMSTRWPASAPIVAPTSSTMLSPRMVGHMRRWPGARYAPWSSGRPWPSPSGRRYCRQRRRHPPPRPGPPARRATWRTCPAPSGWPGSAFHPWRWRYRYAAARSPPSAWDERSEGARSRVSLPNIRKRRPGWRSRAKAAPGTTTDGTMVAPHRIERNAHRLRHERLFFLLSH